MMKLVTCYVCTVYYKTLLLFFAQFYYKTVMICLMSFITKL